MSSLQLLLEAECCTKVRQQPKTANIAQVVSLRASNEVSIPVDANNEYLYYKAAMQHTQPALTLLSLIIL